MIGGIVMAAALVASAGTAKGGGTPTPCELADQIIYYVADVVIVANPGAGPPRARLALDPNGPAGAPSDHRYFEIDAVDMASPIGAAYVAMLSSRFDDRRWGVEPKCKAGANAGRDGSIGAPFVIGQLSFGALPTGRRR